MAELLLINPTPSNRKAGGRAKSRTKAKVKKMATRKRRTAKQVAATRKLVAFNKRRRSPKRTVRAAPKRRRRTSSLSMYKSNPIRRKRRAVRRSPARRIMRRRRNPTNIINSTIMPAFQAAMGAIGLDMIWGYVPVPENWKTGQLRHVVKGAGAIVAGMIAERVVGRPMATKLVHGALTVQMHGAVRELIQTNFPQVQLGYYSAGMPAGSMGEYSRLNGMGAYIGGGGTSPYLSPSNLSTSFQGPSAANMASTACLESESNMGHYY